VVTFGVESAQCGAEECVPPVPEDAGVEVWSALVVRFAGDHQPPAARLSTQTSTVPRQAL